MINLGETIDKLIEVSMTSEELSDDCRSKLDETIEELIHFYFEYSYKNGNKLVPAMANVGSQDFRDLSPEEVEEFKEFEMMVRTVMDDDVAMA